MKKESCKVFLLYQSVRRSKEELKQDFQTITQQNAPKGKSLPLDKTAAIKSFFHDPHENETIHLKRPSHKKNNEQIFD